MIAGDIVVALTLLLDPIAAVALIVIVFKDNKSHFLPKWQRIGICILVAGLIAQAHRSGVAIHTGEAPRDSELFLWALKDLGIAFMAVTACYLHHKGRYYS